MFVFLFCRGNWSDCWWRCWGRNCTSQVLLFDFSTVLFHLITNKLNFFVCFCSTVGIQFLNMKWKIWHKSVQISIAILELFCTICVVNHFFWQSIHWTHSNHISLLWCFFFLFIINLIWLISCFDEHFTLICMCFGFIRRALVKINEETTINIFVTHFSYSQQMQCLNAFYLRSYVNEFSGSTYNSQNLIQSKFCSIVKSFHWKILTIHITTS